MTQEQNENSKLISGSLRTAIDAKQLSDIWEDVSRWWLMVARNPDNEDIFNTACDRWEEAEQSVKDLIDDTRRQK